MPARIFFVSDVHGSERCFRKFINAASFYKADVLILGGDITGKVLVPIIDNYDGTYSLTLFGDHVVVDSRKLEECKKMLRDAGQYYYVTSKNEYEELSSNKEKMDKIFNECMVSTIRAWIELANTRLKGSKVRCFISPGNDDRFEIDEVLRDNGIVINPENRIVEVVPKVEMITLGFSNPTPWKSPREVTEDKLAEMIDKLASSLANPSSSIFNLHVPPFGTEIDKAPAIDEEFKYIKEGLSSVKTVYAGSKAVRSAIERYQPLLGLHGHIHESRGVVKINRTICINPGSEYSNGVLRGALIIIDGERVKEYMLTSG